MEDLRIASTDISLGTDQEPGLTCAIESASEILDLAAAGRQVAATLGFEHFIYAFRAPVSQAHPRQFILSGYPPTWLEHYERNGYLGIDPVAARALDTVLPFSWDELDRSDPVVRRLFQEAAAHGLRHGFSVPVHAARGEGGVLSLARAAPPLPATAGPRQRLFQQAQWWAAVLHQKLRQLVLEQHTVPLRRLTPRERDCLALAAEGQSAQAIARTLGIAERTAVFHLNHATEKLGARRRQQAVARAVALGQIEPACYPAHFSDSAQLVELK